jgi:hypothetical protein
MPAKPIILIDSIFEKGAYLGERKRQEKAVGLECGNGGNA